MKTIRGKKADVSMGMEFLIRLIAAIIGVVVLIMLIVAIIKIVSPSEDKSSKDSLKALYTLMNSKATSIKSYDSGKISLYLKEDYQIFYFKEGSPGSQLLCDPNVMSSKYVLRPSRCKDDTKSCICLYKDDPDINNKDANVLQCEQYNNIINLNEGLPIYDKNCDRTVKNYFSLIIAVQKTSAGNVIYVWMDDANGRKKDEDFKKQKCPIDPQSAVICNGRSIDESIDDPLKYNEVLDICKLQNKMTITATCEYDSYSNKCTVACKDNVFECANTIKSCEDYNTYTESGFGGGKYIIPKSHAEWACTNNLCGFSSQCSIKPFYYEFCDDQSCVNDITALYNNYKNVCNAGLEAYRDSVTNKDIIILTYQDKLISDNPKSSCQDVLFANSAIQKIQVFTYDKTKNAQDIQDPKYAKCGFHDLNGGVRMVGLYAQNDNDCQAAISNYLIPLEGCVTS